MDVHDILQRLKGHSCSQDKVKFTPHDAVSHLLNPTRQRRRHIRACLQPLNRCAAVHSTPQKQTKPNENTKRAIRSQVAGTTQPSQPSFSFHLSRSIFRLPIIPPRTPHPTSSNEHLRQSTNVYRIRCRSFVRSLSLSFVVLSSSSSFVVVQPVRQPVSQSVSQLESGPQTMVFT